jgi:hypothetical protein
LLNNDKNKCEGIDCGIPPKITNTIVRYNSTEFESMAFYTCADKRFIISGEETTTTCLANGKWSQASPSCIRNYV